MCGILLQPVVPDLSSKLLTKLNVKPETRKWSDAEKLSQVPKRALSTESVVLFRKIKE